MNIKLSRSVSQLVQAGLGKHRGKDPNAEAEAEPVQFSALFKTRRNKGLWDGEADKGQNQRVQAKKDK